MFSTALNPKTNRQIQRGQVVMFVRIMEIKAYLMVKLSKKEG